MPSPFPGMNPYLEQESAWHDFHENFMPAAQEMLNRQIMPKYFAKIDEHVYIQEPDENSQRSIGGADVWIAQRLPHVPAAGAVQTLEAPALVEQVPVEEERLAFLEIRDRDRRRLVCVIELLSPANKQPGRDRNQYLRKRDEYLASEAHFIEIDLLRSGPRLPWREMPSCDYYAVVSRVEKRPGAGVWPIRLRDPLPVIAVPLLEGDPDARLNLQAILHHIYDAAGYALYIYDSPPNPPLSAEDAAWAQQIRDAANP